MNNKIKFGLLIGATALTTAGTVAGVTVAVIKHNKAKELEKQIEELKKQIEIVRNESIAEIQQDQDYYKKLGDETKYQFIVDATNTTLNAIKSSKLSIEQIKAIKATGINLNKSIWEQYEAYESFFKEQHEWFNNQINNNNDKVAEAFANLSVGFFAGEAKQPEAHDAIFNNIKNILLPEILNSNANNCAGLGKIGSNFSMALGTQPASEGSLLQCLYMAIEQLKTENISKEKANSISACLCQALLSVSSQPEALKKITVAEQTIFTQCIKSTDFAAVTLEIAGPSMIYWTGKQPSADATLIKAAEQSLFKYLQYITVDTNKTIGNFISSMFTEIANLVDDPQFATKAQEVTNKYEELVKAELGIE